MKNKYFYPIFKLKVKSWIRYWLLKKTEFKGKLSEILSGFTFNLQNTLRQKFVKFEIEGHSEQETTSIAGGDEYDSPSPDHEQPIKSCGENAQLFDKETMGTRIYRYFVGDGNWNTASDSYSIAIPCQPNKTYTISHSTSGATIFRCAYIKEATIPDTGSITLYNQYMSTTALSHTIETGEGATYIVFQGNASLMPDIINTLKLEEGTEVTPGLKYFNGMGTITEKIINKNWFDKDTVTASALQVDGTTLSSTTLKTSDFIPIDTTKIYYKTATGSARIKLYDKNKNAINTTNTGDISNFGNAQSFTIPSGFSSAKYIRFSMENQYVDTMQLELGTTESTYIEHEEQTYTIPTQQPMRSIGDVRDIFVKVNGNWYERHIKYFRVTKDMIRGAGTYGVNSWVINAPETVQYVVNVATYKCSHFKSVPYEERTTGGNNIVYTTTAGTTFEFRNTTFSTQELFEAFLDNNEVYLLYIPVTPTDLPCTAEQIAVLENLPYTYDGETNIYSIDEIPAYLKIQYYEKGE